MNPVSRTLRVATVQMASKVGDILGNLERATPLAERAAGSGAQLILFPELMPGGYTHSEALWYTAEPHDGASAQWMAATSKRLGVWLALTFLEAEGEDFFNTLILTRPDGTEAGRSRKQTPAAFEAWFFKGEPSRHVIDTELGRIGIGICMDNQMSWLPGLLHEESVDLVLQPHAWSLPNAPWATMTQRVLDRDHSVQKGVAPHYARLLGVPALFTNQVGPWEPASPGRWPKPPPSHFPGHATIADSDGTVRAQADADEAVIVADVTLDPSRKAKHAPARHGSWTFPGPPLRGLVQMLARWGSVAYARSKLRREQAMGIASQGGPRRPAVRPQVATAA